MWKVLIGIAAFVGALTVLSLRECGRGPVEYGERPGARKQVIRAALEQNLPHRLAGLERREVVQGPEALAEVAGLHAKGLPLTAGTIGRYGAGATRATLWVGWALGPEQADALVEHMTAGIRRGGSPFRAVEAVVSGERPVVRLTGMGQQHVYFAAGNRIVWAAADSALIQPVTEELLRWYPE